jgi:hypothetical protein
MSVLCRLCPFGSVTATVAPHIEYIPSDSSLAFTTYREPPESAAKRATRSSNSWSKSESSSEGKAPITGGSSASRYERNISESNVTTGSVDVVS